MRAHGVHRRGSEKEDAVAAAREDARLHFEALHSHAAAYLEALERAEAATSAASERLKSERRLLTEERRSALDTLEQERARAEADLARLREDAVAAAASAAAKVAAVVPRSPLPSASPLREALCCRCREPLAATSSTSPDGTAGLLAPARGARAAASLALQPLQSRQRQAFSCEGRARSVEPVAVGGGTSGAECVPLPMPVPSPRWSSAASSAAPPGAVPQRRDAPGGTTSQRTASPGPDAARRPHRGLLVLGGEDAAGSLDSTELLDLDAMIFGPGPRLTVRRAGGAAAVLDAQHAVVAGGVDGCIILESTDVLDLTTMTFSSGPILCTRRHLCGAAALGDGRMLVVGGAASASGGERLASTELLSGVGALRLAPGPCMAARRSGCAVVRLTERHVMVLGGFDGTSSLASTEILDLVSMEFTPGPPMHTARRGCAAVLLDQGILIVLGGVQESLDGSVRLNSTDLLDFKSMKFSTGPVMSCKRSASAAVRLDRGRAIVIGGFDGDAFVETTEIFDVSTMSFQPGPSMRSRRAACAVVTL